VCQISRLKNSHKKRYSKSTNMYSYEQIFIVAHFDTLPRIEIFFFAMKFLSWDHLYVDNMCSKFQVQKIYQKKDIWNLPTWVVLRQFSILLTLTPSQGLKIWYFALKFFSWDHLYVENMSSKFQVHKIYPKKDISNLSTCVVVRMIFSTLGIVSFCGSKFFRDVKNLSHN